jgi:hypothetical protein
MPTRIFRGTLGAVGVVIAAAGVRLLVVDTAPGTVFPVATWLMGAVALHDLLLAPLVLLAGFALRRPLSGAGAGAGADGASGSTGTGSAARGAVAGPLRAGLLVAGCLTLVALPVLLRPGTPRNATALPLDYPRNWALLTAGVLVATLLMAAGTALLRRRSSRKGRPDAVH